MNAENLLAASVLCLFAPTLDAQSVRLNVPLTAQGGPEGQVFDAALSPDGEWAVYIATEELLYRDRLYSAPFAGGPSLRLSPDFDPLLASAARPTEPTGPGGTGPGGSGLGNGSQAGEALPGSRAVLGFRITPDSRTVLFWIANPPNTNTAELYARPIDGSGPARRLVRSLEAPLANGRGLILLDDRVILNDLEGQLLSVSLDGSSPPLRLSTDQVAGTPLIVAPSGNEVVFWGRPNGSPGAGFFHRVPLDASTPPERLGRPQDNTHARSIVSFSASNRVAFRAVSGFDTEVLSVSLESGSEVTELGLGTSQQELAAADDGDTLLYRASGARLFAIPSDRSTDPVLLDGPSMSGSVVDILDVTGSSVIYTVGPGPRRLYATEITGGTPRHLSAELELQLSFLDVAVPVLQNGSHVAFRESLDGTLWSAPLDGATPARRLSDLRTFEFARASDERLLFLATGESGAGLFDVDFPGETAPRRVSAPEDGQVTSLVPVVAEEADAIAYFVQTPNVQLFGRALETDEEPRRLNDDLAQGAIRGDVRTFLLSPDGTRVAYVADAKIDRRFDLFVVPLDLSSPAVRPGPEPTEDSFQDILQTTFSADGRFLAFIVARGPEDRELHVHDVSAGAASRRIEPVDGSLPQDFLFAEGGDRIVFTTTDGSGSTDLWSVPTSGGSPALLDTLPVLSPILYLVPGDEFLIYESPVGLRLSSTDGNLPARTVIPLTTRFYGFTPDGARGILMLGAGSGTLYSLNLATGGLEFLDDVQALGGLRFDGLGQRIAYTADNGSGQRLVYGVRTDGSEPAVALATANNVSTVIALTPDGSRVIYTNLFTGRVFTVPGDGSGPPVVLEGVGTEIAFTPDSRFLASTRSGLVLQPVDGSSPAQPVTEEAAQPSVPRFLADGTMVFVADLGVGRALYQVSVESPGTPTRLTEVPRSFGRGPGTFELAAEEDSVVFLSTHLSRDVVQLYSTETVPGLGAASQGPRPELQR